MTEVTVADLVAMVGGRLIGDGSQRIVSIGDLRTAGPDRIGFVRDPRYADAAKATRAGALLLVEPLETQASQIVVPDVDVAYAKVASHFHPRPRATVQSIHPTAVVDAGAELVSPVTIGPRAVVEGRLVFKREVELFVSDSAKIGAVEGAKAVSFSGAQPQS